jgi:L-lactate dehydrogenase (cytochrome)
VFEILRDETATAMRLLDVERVEELGPRHVNTRAVERDIWDGLADLLGREGALWAKAKSGMIMSLSSVNN